MRRRRRRRSRGGEVGEEKWGRRSRGGRGGEEEDHHVFQYTPTVALERILQHSAASV